MHYCGCKGTTKLQLLQRVFQRMLTKVDDTVSFLFMKHFYSSLFSKHNLLDAYHEAIRKLIIDYPDPYDWAGFILVFN